MKMVISERIVDSFSKKGIIESEDKELYAYGLQQGLWMFLNFLSTIIIGLVFNMLLQSIIFMFAYIPLRTHAGGIHSRSQIRCYLFSIVIMIAALLGMKLVLWTSFICFVITLSGGVIIYFLAPVEDENKPLDQMELKIYKKRTGIILLIEVVISFVLLLLNQQSLLTCIAMVFVVLSIMLIAGKVKNQINQRVS